MRTALLRRRHGRMLSGVARGLAEYFAIDVFLVRAAFVLLAFAGVGIALYLAGWVLIPAEDEQSSIGERLLERLQGAPPWLLIVLAVGVGLILVGQLSNGGPVIWALLLIAAGVWLYRRDGGAWHGGAWHGGAWHGGAWHGGAWHGGAWHNSPGPGAPGEQASGAPGSQQTPSDQPQPYAYQDFPGTQGYAGTPGYPATAYPGTTGPAAWQAGGPTGPSRSVVARSPRPVRPPRPKSLLGRYTLAGLLVVLGLAAALDNLGTVHVAARVYPALALMVVGAGLVVGAIWGRSRLLILAGLLILPVAASASLLRVPLSGGAGERRYVPQSAQNVPTAYRLGAGSLRINLTTLQWPAAPLTVRARVAFGQIVVTVPASATIELRARVGAGVIQLPDQTQRSGVSITQQTVLASSQSGGPQLVLDAETSFGTIIVNREPSRVPVPSPPPPAAAIPVPRAPALPRPPVPAPGAPS